MNYRIFTLIFSFYFIINCSCSPFDHLVGLFKKKSKNHSIFNYPEISPNKLKSQTASYLLNLYEENRHQFYTYVFGVQEWAYANKFEDYKLSSLKCYRQLIDFYHKSSSEFDKNLSSSLTTSMTFLCETTPNRQFNGFYASHITILSHVFNNSFSEFDVVVQKLRDFYHLRMFEKESTDYWIFICTYFRTVRNTYNEEPDENAIRTFIKLVSTGFHGVLPLKIILTIYDHFLVEGIFIYIHLYFTFYELVKQEEKDALAGAISKLEGLTMDELNKRRKACKVTLTKWKTTHLGLIGEKFPTTIRKICSFLDCERI
ncbi:hypothetical protein SNEBB_001789 [Seison nebaliae]|nr:hypothetical protein SNEBB_001789 [Seison nebaliae]